MARIAFQHTHMGIMGIDFRLACEFGKFESVTVAPGAYPHGNLPLRWVFLMTPFTGNAGVSVLVRQKQLLRSPNQRELIHEGKKENPKEEK